MHCRDRTLVGDTLTGFSLGSSRHCNFHAGEGNADVLFPDESISRRRRSMGTAMHGPVREFAQLYARFLFGATAKYPLDRNNCDSDRITIAAVCGPHRSGPVHCCFVRRLVHWRPSHRPVPDCADWWDRSPETTCVVFASGPKRPAFRRSARHPGQFFGRPLLFLLRRFGAVFLSCNWHS